jgi:transcriptional regulator with XRE-family HTH domain
MDTAWFLSQLDRAGLSQADLARHLRLAPSAVSRMLKGERQMKLLEAAQTASFLGASQDEVLRRASGEGPPMATPEGPRRRGRPPLATTQLRQMTGTEPIPIRSAARGGGEQEMFLEDGPTRWSRAISRGGCCTSTRSSRRSGAAMSSSTKTTRRR